MWQLEAATHAVHVDQWRLLTTLSNEPMVNRLHDVRTPAPAYCRMRDAQIGRTSHSCRGDGSRAQVLVKIGARIIDLLRNWDTDNDGKISRREFSMALRRYGCPAETKDVQALFDKWDKDGSNKIDLLELHQVSSAKRADRHASFVA